MKLSRALVALPVTLILGVSLIGTAAVADPPAAPGSKASPAGQDHRAEQAEAALARVEAILAGDAAQRGGVGGRLAAGRSLTVALRDLAVLVDALPAADRQRAQQILRRPAASKRACTKFICVHYTRTGPHRPALRDRNRNGHPDYIDTVRKTVHAIHVKYKKAGYRSPLPDRSRGGDRRTDIYIRNIGSQGIYGYCTTDDPKNFGPEGWNGWAYCVLDNNYSRAEFPTNAPLENMKVTAAHEYFHAVQYSYDVFEDGWILESTAAWVEDEMFDAVNDNRQYLARSPISHPHIPADLFESGGVFHYGTWLWWRYLTERYPSSSAGLPTLVRDVWRRLDGKVGAIDEYSLQGIESVLGARGTDLTTQFANFADANRHPGNQYEEGGAYNGHRANPVLRTLTSVAPSGSATRSLDHLTSSTVRFVPGSGITGATWQLDLDLNLDDADSRPAAVVTEFEQDGSTSSQRVGLDGTGIGTVTVPFDATTVSYVEVTMVNASNRFTCFVGPPFDSPFSCLGDPTDENVPAQVTGTALQP